MGIAEAITTQQKIAPLLMVSAFPSHIFNVALYSQKHCPTSSRFNRSAQLDLANKVFRPISGRTDLKEEV